MRNTFYLVLAFVLMLSACANSSKNDGSVNTESKETNTVSSDVAVDLCKCLTEPGNSEYMQEHGEACDALISKEIGVADWKKVNMSQNRVVSDRFDALARRCTGGDISSTEMESPKEEVNIDGIYEGTQNISGLLLEAKLVIRGNRWSATSQLGYDGPELQNGVVQGTDLYDDSGMLKIGYVSGNSARIEGYPSMYKN